MPSFQDIRDYYVHVRGLSWAEANEYAREDLAEGRDPREEDS